MSTLGLPRRVAMPRGASGDTSVSQSRPSPGKALRGWVRAGREVQMGRPGESSRGGDPSYGLDLCPRTSSEAAWARPQLPVARAGDRLGGEDVWALEEMRLWQKGSPEMCGDPQTHT